MNGSDYLNCNNYEHAIFEYFITIEVAALHRLIIYHRPIECTAVLYFKSQFRSCILVGVLLLFSSACCSCNVQPFKIYVNTTTV